ncbi:hypothetical protein METP3_00442 [Methanosarcinales archaeon]|nr:hypothetical protein METP3_00442 [Methanosarcinales archaeon]
MKFKLILLTIFLIILIPVIPTSENIQDKEDFLVSFTTYPNTIPSEVKRISDKQTNINTEISEEERQIILESDNWKFILDYEGFDTTVIVANVTHFEKGLPFIIREVEIVRGVYPVFIASYFDKINKKNMTKKLYLISEFVDGIDYSNYLENSKNLIPGTTEHKIGNINIINRKTNITHKSDLSIENGKIKEDTYIFDPENGRYKEMFDAEVILDIEYVAIIQTRVSIISLFMKTLENKPDIIVALIAIIGLGATIITERRFEQIDRKVKDLSKDIEEIKNNNKETSSPQEKDETNKEGR